MNESILQQFNCCASCYSIAFFTVFLTLFMSSPSSHKKLESPLIIPKLVKHRPLAQLLSAHAVDAEGIGFKSRVGQIGTVSPTACHRCDVAA